MQGCQVKADLSVLNALNRRDKKGYRTVKSSVTARHINVPSSWVGFFCVSTYPLLLQSLPDIQILLVQETDSFLVKGFVFLLQQRKLL